MASAHRRHQESLEGFINFSCSPPLAADVRSQAEKRFYDIVDHFRDRENLPTDKQYDRPKLVRLVYEHAITDKSKDNVLRAFFRALELPIDESEDIEVTIKDTEERLLPKLLGFADYLVNNFFLPLKASTKQTPQPSPAYHSATQSIQAGGQSFAGTPVRLSALRGNCLVRDRHRCVISRRFDRRKAMERVKGFGDKAQDDDGHPLTGASFAFLEVAHILPHSLVKTNLDSREAALQILNMFDNDVAHLIEGPDIDRPRNALTLAPSLHRDFGDFQIYFEPAGAPNTYRIGTFLPAMFHTFLPVTRTLFLAEDGTIEPPSPRLLAIHRAIAHILFFSAAGRYIDRILEDLEDQTVRVDGSTHLAQLVQLKIDNWLVGIGT